MGKIADLTEKLMFLVSKSTSHYNYDVASSLATRVLSDFFHEITRDNIDYEEVEIFCQVYRNHFVSDECNESDFN